MSRSRRLCGPAEIAHLSCSLDRLGYVPPRGHRLGLGRAPRSCDCNSCGKYEVTLIPYGRNYGGNGFQGLGGLMVLVGLIWSGSLLLAQPEPPVPPGGLPNIPPPPSFLLQRSATLRRGCAPRGNLSSRRMNSPDPGLVLPGMIQRVLGLTDTQKKAVAELQNSV